MWAYGYKRPHGVSGQRGCGRMREEQREREPQRRELGKRTCSYARHGCSNLGCDQARGARPAGLPADRQPHTQAALRR